MCYWISQEINICNFIIFSFKYPYTICVDSCFTELQDCKYSQSNPVPTHMRCWKICRACPPAIVFVFCLTRRQHQRWHGMAPCDTRPSGWSIDWASQWVNLKRSALMVDEANKTVGKENGAVRLFAVRLHAGPRIRARDGTRVWRGNIIWHNVTFV